MIGDEVQFSDAGIKHHSVSTVCFIFPRFLLIYIFLWFQVSALSTGVVRQIVGRDFHLKFVVDFPNCLGKMCLLSHLKLVAKDYHNYQCQSCLKVFFLMVLILSLCLFRVPFRYLYICAKFANICIFVQIAIRNSKSSININLSLFPLTRRTQSHWILFQMVLQSTGPANCDIQPFLHPLANHNWNNVFHSPIGYWTIRPLSKTLMPPSVITIVSLKSQMVMKFGKYLCW